MLIRKCPRFHIPCDLVIVPPPTERKGSVYSERWPVLSIDT